MAQKKIEDLSTETLLKRKKLATWLLWVMVFAALQQLLRYLPDLRISVKN